MLNPLIWLELALIAFGLILAVDFLSRAMP